MEDLIKDIPKQFEFEPEIENGAPPAAKFFIVGGMGGSHLAADMLRAAGGAEKLFVHKNYGLPTLPEEISKNALHIAVSYSGNTEETSDFAEKALLADQRVAVIATGGKLISFAKEKKLPFIRLPKEEALPPRMATGLMMVALLKLMNDESKLSVLRTAATKVSVANCQKESERISKVVGDKIPLVYASEKNVALASYLKIIINETAKTPAFFNIFPELNHNEMNAYPDSSRFKDFVFVVVGDKADHPRITKRMEVFEKIILEKGGKMVDISLSGSSRFEEILNYIVLSHSVAYQLSKLSGADPLTVPTVEEFKKLIV